jgi:uncharacterized protein
MPKRILDVFLGFLTLVTFAFAQEYSKPTGYVNDFAHVLSREQAESLNTELIEFAKKTSVEIAVVTVSSLDGQDVETYTRGLATAWGVGKTGKNNGVVFLVAPNERKERIQPASGSRPILTDSILDEIRDTVILPAFRRGDMAAGIIDGSQAIIRVFDEEPPRSRENTKTLKLIVAGVISVVLLLVIIVPPIRRSRARACVIEEESDFTGRLTKAESVGANLHVKDETRNQLSKIKGDFTSLSRMTADSDNVNWIESRAKLIALGEQLDSAVSTMKKEIADAKEARKVERLRRLPQAVLSLRGQRAAKEALKLMKQLPRMMAAAEKQLAKGKKSKQAVRYLTEARDQYARAQSVHQPEGEMSMIDWIIICDLLSSAHSNCETAQEAHSSVNPGHSSGSWFGNPGGFSGHGGSGGGGGFDSGGSSGGFGGGGGFDGGGGSSGSW